ncbi:MAG: hypothetical protein HFG45_08840 [Oscillospiraceae bacterium]|jgi:hypothetical protein|nr:hypothetical protein [Oscillospiraceae bacterium]
MKKRLLSLALALTLVMLMGQLPATVRAEEESAHDHTGWTAVTMGDAYIKLGEEEQTSNTLPAGNYYLDGDLTVALTVTGGRSACV